MWGWLTRARLARDNYDLLSRGIDPAKPEPGKKSFGDVAREFLDKNKGKWTSARHVEQWTDTFCDRQRADGSKVPAATALLNPIACDMVDKGAVLRVLDNMTDTPSTLHKVRGRIEAVLNYAAARGYRDENKANPAAWVLLEHAGLPVHDREQHHAALPPKAIIGFMRKLRGETSLSCRALEFAILTAARTGEVRGARWSEINMDEATWTIPPQRMDKLTGMKGKKEHVVPLSARAMEILRSLPREREYVFPGAAGPCLSKNALDICLKALNPDVTTHGMRSTFRDWAGDETSHDDETIEFALAHKIPDRTKAAYRRYTALDKRRRLMEEWAGYCGGSSSSGTVLQLRTA
jgi:integrase